MPQPKYMRDELASHIKAGVAEVGEHSYGGPLLRFANSGQRFICGRYCSFSLDVHVFLGGNHRHDWVTTYPFPNFEAWPEVGSVTDHHGGRGDVVVGNDVWVGERASIGSGVTIGSGVVIATRATVTKDVPPYAIVAGVPARIIRYRFDPETIAALMEISWWDWPDDRVRMNLPLLMQGDIEKFIEQHRL